MVAGGIRTRHIARRYPVTTGLTAETTKTEGRTTNLVYQYSIVPKREKKGMS